MGRGFGRILLQVTRAKTSKKILIFLLVFKKRSNINIIEKIKKKGDKLIMKFDRLQIKLLIGLIVFIILYLLIVILEPKENNNDNITNEKVYMEKNQNNIEKI